MRIFVRMPLSMQKASANAVTHGAIIKKMSTLTVFRFVALTGGTLFNWGHHYTKTMTHTGIESIWVKLI